MAPLRSLSPYLGHLWVLMFPKSSLKSSLQINSPVSHSWKCCLGKWPTKGGSIGGDTAIWHRTPAAPSQGPKFCLFPPNPHPNSSFASGSVSLPLGLVSFKMAIFPSFWPWPFYFLVLVCSNCLGLWTWPLCNKTTLFNVNTHTHQHLAQHHSFFFFFLQRIKGNSQTMFGFLL